MTPAELFKRWESEGGEIHGDGLIHPIGLFNELLASGYDDYLIDDMVIIGCCDGYDDSFEEIEF